MGRVSTLEMIPLLWLALTAASGVGAQDMYGAQYAHVSPDEARPRLRQLPPEPGMGGPVVDACGEYQFECSNGQCIPEYDVCNGIPQCADSSDELNCHSRFRQQGPAPGGAFRMPDARPQAPQQRPAQVTATDTPSPSSSTPAPQEQSLLLPLKLVFAGAAAFILVAGLGHVVLKRRQAVRATIRNYRKGQSLMEDEDDLLISQMYS